MQPSIPILCSPNENTEQNFLVYAFEGDVNVHDNF